jgi:hypothetical protein
MPGTITSRILSDDMVEDAVMATLRLWIPSKLSEVEASLGLAPGYYQRPRSWEVRTGFDKFPEEMLPMIIVVSIGTDDRPEKDGSQAYRATFDIGVIGVVDSLDRTHARRFAYRLGAAARAALIHNQSLDLALGGTVRGVTPLGWINTDLPPEDDRTIRTQRQAFRVEVGNVITMNAGPATPPVDGSGNPIPDPPPTGDWPVIADRTKIRTTITHAEVPSP